MADRAELRLLEEVTVGGRPVRLTSLPKGLTVREHPGLLTSEGTKRAQVRFSSRHFIRGRTCRS